MDTQTSLSARIISNLIVCILAIFLVSFAFSFVIAGIGGIVLALIGGIANSVVIRLIRIKRKEMLLGFIASYLVALVVLIWIALQLNFSIYPWAGAVFVLTLGITRIFLPDETLAEWLDRVSSKSSENQ